MRELPHDQHRGAPLDDANGHHLDHQPSLHPDYTRARQLSENSGLSTNSHATSPHLGFNAHAPNANIDPRLEQSATTTHMQGRETPLGSNDAPATPSVTASPRFNTSTSSENPSVPKQYFTPYNPQDRRLPSKDVNDDNIADLYAEFILYCNPFFPVGVDTTELKRAFQNPPKSDGKSFNIFSLFDLIRKFSRKEITTWTQLALDLGVEPPSTEKGQSTQKVQQYSVRLKRWMRAMHVDSFFEYLLDKPHIYWTQIPAPDAPHPESSRDGVPIEEDLAIRAIDPSYRPKRGRRKLDEQEEEGERAMTPTLARRSNPEFAFSPHPYSAQPMSAFPSSAAPVSAHPDSIDRFSLHNDQWPSSSVPPGVSGSSNNKLLTPHSAIAPSTPQHLRWRFQSQGHVDTSQSAHPLSAQPMSAVTPISGVPPSESAFEEPLSAMTPTTENKKKRRRHGPAVSSAWSSSNQTPNGKLRGRPPANRSVRDGPYVTFPANPQRGEAPIIDMRTSATPGADRGEGGPISAHPLSAIDTSRETLFESQAQAGESAPNTAGVSTPASAGPSARARPSIQIPKHTGAPVQEVGAAGNPTVLINGQSERPANFGASDQRSSQPMQVSLGGYSGGNGSSISGTTFAHSDSFPQAEVQTQTKPSFTSGAGFPDQHIERRSQQPDHMDKSRPPRQAAKMPQIESDELKNALALELINVQPTNRARLKRNEAKNLAEALLLKLQNEQVPTSPTEDEEAAQDFQKLTAAMYLGLIGRLKIETPNAPKANKRKIAVRRYKNGDSDFPLDDDDTSTVGVTESFDISWTLELGDLSGEFSIKGVKLVDDPQGKSGAAGGLNRLGPGMFTPGPNAGVSVGGPREGPGHVTDTFTKDPMHNAIMWKRRFEEVRKRADKQEKELDELKERIMSLVI
ncbi:MAG: hypothetical protein M1820_010443 [Bogoriella megaspora]|nr:MAG: hypothetical protein M1820_010443 [Bogoriella megaspora]